MNILIVEAILADRQDGDDIGWVRLLIFVILAILFGLGRLLKSKADASEEDQQYASAPGRRKPTGAAKPMDKRPVGQPRRPVPVAPAKELGPRTGRPGRQLARPQATLRKPVVPGQRRLIRGAPGGLVKPARPVETKLPSLPHLEQPGQILAEPLAELEHKMPVARVQEPEAATILERLLDFEDPEDLQKAVLHYEILGKPLGLRGPSEQLRRVL